MSKLTVTSILNTVFSILNDSGLDYCVQNKYEMMPEEIPSDIDIFYRGANEKDLDNILRLIAEKTGLGIIQKTPMGYYGFVYILSYLKPTEFFRLQLDFQFDFSFKKRKHIYIPHVMLDNKRFYKMFYVPSYYDEIIYTFIRRTLKKDFDSDHLDLICSLYKNDEIVIRRELEKTFPSNLFKLIMLIIDNRDVALFYDNIELFNTYIINQSRKNSTLKRSVLQNIFNLTNHFPNRVIKPMGLSITLLSPDGGGKSSVIKEIMKTCSGAFHGIDYHYFRPRLLKNPGSYNFLNPTHEISINPDPHGRPLNSRLKSACRYFFYNLDFLFGYFIKIYPKILKRKLVIFDRYYYDYYVDLKRYQYNLPKWIPRFFSFMIPNPSIVFVLDASGEVLYNRKRELNINELERQRIMYKGLINIVKNVIIIDASQPLNKVIEDITFHIHENKRKQTISKMK